MVEKSGGRGRHGWNLERRGEGGKVVWSGKGVADQFPWTRLV